MKLPRIVFFLTTVLLGTSGVGFAESPPETKPTPAEVTAPPAEPKADPGDTAWMLTATGLVMLMVPGLALFYGGLARRKNLLGTMMHSMVALVVVGVQWVLFGYCLAFGASQAGLMGWSPDYLGLMGVKPTTLFPGTNVPVYVHCMYQGMFAIITPALISGAIAERIRFGPYCLFILLWTTLVYDPLAHWVWAVNAEGKPAGWLGQMGALDFAGGTVVHIAAGVSGLAAILVLRKRIGYPEHAMHPSSMVLSLLGAGLLWFGWFGFNGGSGVGSGALAGSALAATQAAAASAGLVWMLIEWVHRKKPTALGLATGIVAGLVAVTPASGFVSPAGGLAIGAVASCVCYCMVVLKPFFGYDDSLDAFGVHGVGGFVGAILTGVFASKLINDAGADGGAAQVATQTVAAGIAFVYSFVLSLILVKVIDLAFGFCLSPEEESDGLDRAAHGEVGFDLSAAFAEVPEAAAPEPRAATVPPNGQGHFVVMVEGAPQEVVARTWSELCRNSLQSPTSEFLGLFPHFSTMRGNRFRFRSGDPAALTSTLERIFAERLPGKKVRALLEN